MQLASKPGKEIHHDDRRFTKTKTMTKILLADDHAMIRIGLKILIADHLAHSVVDEVSNGKQEFKKCKNRITI
jgi:hypothetical protein